MKHQQSDANQQLRDLLGASLESPMAVRSQRAGREETPVRISKKAIDLSFIFFSDANQRNHNKYELVFELAEFGDNHGFKALWLPERHFHPFGGIYPNPAVLAAAIAVRTQNIRLRSGSVVLPLHHPTGVVESWAMVDNLSGGRVDLGFASGWNPNDFVANPVHYEKRRDLWHERIPMVQKLWRGESLPFRNGADELIQTQVFPRPLQADIDIWLVITRSDDSFRYAGEMGYNVLTMLQGFGLDELARKIEIYRDGRGRSGLDPTAGQVTLMLHTLVHENRARVEIAVRDPFFQYIKSALSGHLQAMKKQQELSEGEMNKIVEYSYQRYFTTGALFGSVADAMRVVHDAQQCGVNEIACLMDFGIDDLTVRDSLPYLKELRESVSKAA